MLSYEDCVELREAGFADAMTLCAYDHHRELHCEPDTGWATHMTACPNSDELMADMQRRWATRVFVFDLRVAQRVTYASAHYGGATVGRGEGDTPAAALCSLYLALAAQDTPPAGDTP